MAQKTTSLADMLALAVKRSQRAPRAPSKALPRFIPAEDPRFAIQATVEAEVEPGLYTEETWEPETFIREDGTEVISVTVERPTAQVVGRIKLSDAVLQRGRKKARAAAQR